MNPRQLCEYALASCNVTDGLKSEWFNSTRVYRETTKLRRLIKPSIGISCWC